MAELDVETIVKLARMLVKNRKNQLAVELFVEALSREFEDEPLLRDHDKCEVTS